MVVFINVLPWIQTMYKTDFCQLENDKQFETESIIKKNVGENYRYFTSKSVVMFYIFMNMHIS